MATSKEYIDFVCEQIEGIGDISTCLLYTSDAADE